MLVHEVADVGHGHASADHDLLEAQLLGGALVGVIVRVAVEEGAAHLKRDGVRVALYEVAVGDGEPSGAALRLRVAERDLAGRLAEQVALVMMSGGHGFAVGRPEDDLGVDQRSVAVVVYVNDLGGGGVLLAGRDGRVEFPLLAHPEVAEAVLESAARESAVHRGHGHGGRDPVVVGAVGVPARVYFEAVEVVFEHTLVGDELSGAEVFSDMGFFRVVGYVGHISSPLPLRAVTELRALPGARLCRPSRSLAVL